MTHFSHNEQETKQIAQEFAQTLKGGEVVFLSGELGSGKTTFVRGVAEYFGFEKPVRSPTFTIVNRYPISGKTIHQILHIDFYRIEQPSEIVPLALEDELHEPQTVTFIEWPSIGESAKIEPTHRIELKRTNEAHEISIK